MQPWQTHSSSGASPMLQAPCLSPHLGAACVVQIQQAAATSEEHPPAGHLQHRSSAHGMARAGLVSRPTAQIASKHCGGTPPAQKGDEPAGSMQLIQAGGLTHLQRAAIVAHRRVVLLRGGEAVFKCWHLPEYQRLILQSGCRASVAMGQGSGASTVQQRTGRRQPGAFEAKEPASWYRQTGGWAQTELSPLPFVDD
jgi:hypothetical protein